MAMFSACENLTIQELETPEENLATGENGQQIFTATLDADTKVYLDYDSANNVYKTLWAENDQICVINAETGESELCPIIEGVGTTTAKFAGSITADRYIAVYGQNVNNTGSSSASLYMSSYQWGNFHWDDEEYEYKIRFENNVFPMVAKSSSKTFSFQNLCSVLKLTMTGESGDYLDNIRVTANDPETYLSGRINVDVSGSSPLVTFNYGDNYVEFSTWKELSSGPMECFIVLPAQTYAGGLTLEFSTLYGSKTVEVKGDVEMKRSRIRNLNVNLTSYPVYDANQDWYVCISNDDGSSWDSYQMHLEGGMYVCRGLYIENSSNIRFLEANEWVYYGCDSYYNNSWSKTNVCMGLTSGDNWWWYGDMFSEYYDFYVDPSRGCSYIMTSGFSPDNLPTTEIVAYDSYDNLYYYASEEEVVKVFGVVMAQNANGFVLSIDAYGGNNVYVYDPLNLCNGNLDMGYAIDLYAVARTYRGQKELVITEDSYWCYMWLNSYRYYNFEYPQAIDGTSYSSTSFDYVKVTGYLSKSSTNGNTYYSLTDEWGATIASITAPLEDLSSYVGQKVNLEGYYQGSHSNGYAIIVMRDLLPVTGGGTTEEILPGGSITVN